MAETIARTGPWSVQRRSLTAGVDVHDIRRQNRPIAWGEFARGLREDPQLAAAVTEALRVSPHAAFFWECVPWPAGENPSFEFVLVDAPALAGVPPSPRAFSEQLDEDDGISVRSFPNLGNDALLIAPCPGGPLRAYGHLAAFVRRGPQPQVATLWAALGRALARPHPAATRWVSTSGLGVPWLHLRIDRRPKYYTHGPYLRMG